MSMADTIDRALGFLGVGTCIMTSAYDGQRAGMRVLSAQPCSLEPRLIAVAARKGHPIEPLIRDSHYFAICVVDTSQKLVLRKFNADPVDFEEMDSFEDPFDAFAVDQLVTGSPILTKCIAALDCEVVRHFDLEADHEIFVGLVLAARAGV
ncbi:MAG: flavin reductase family protein [Phycisphaeraceae bacterium]|nr:flavin reductase family protein [Phycisphaeraceae bacterium]MCW5763007.1 flavin reductase family protein [Phycisphaeraceae bacterium]